MKIPKYHEHFGPIDGSFGKIPDDARKRVKAIVDQFTAQTERNSVTDLKGSFAFPLSSSRICSSGSRTA
jgi:hypothetical protein